MMPHATFSPPSFATPPLSPATGQAFRFLAATLMLSTLSLSPLCFQFSTLFELKLSPPAFAATPCAMPLPMVSFDAGC
jgi:hypothetical protein